MPRTTCRAGFPALQSSGGVYPKRPGSRRGGAFPWGTFVVNISGALVLGFLFTLLTERLTIALWLRSALLIGFLGAYTTFSMAWQTAL